MQVMQYNPSLEVVSAAGTQQRSDPAMVLVPSRMGLTTDIIFPTSAVSDGGKRKAAKNYLTFVSLSDTKDILTLDGTLIG